jgi:formate dehydrogenase subunit gamma
LAEVAIERTPAATITPAEAAALVARHASAAARNAPGHSLLSVLHAIQDELGYVPEGVVTPLARAMNLSRAEVHGVITYYHHFRTAPPPRVTVQLCRAESCRSMGSEALAAHIEARTGCGFDAQGHGASDTAGHAHCSQGDIGLESVYCLGLCGTSPAMTIDGKLYAKVTPVKFDAAFEAACTRAGIAPKEAA